MNSIFSTSYSLEPPGDKTSTISSFLLPNNARAKGEDTDILPFSTSASSVPTI